MTSSFFWSSPYSARRVHSRQRVARGGSGGSGCCFGPLGAPDTATAVGRVDVCMHVSASTCSECAMLRLTGLAACSAHLDIGGASQTSHALNARAGDKRRNLLAGSCNGRQHNCKLRVHLALCFLLHAATSCDDAVHNGAAAFVATSHSDCPGGCQLKRHASCARSVQRDMSLNETISRSF
jgi:hypothetical protein